MLFSIGTKVKLRYTGERGVITALLEEGMLQVRLDNDPDFEIPTFEEDLLRDTDKEPVSAGAKFVQGGAPSKSEAPPRRSLKSQYIILKPKGLQIAFEPMPGRDGTVSRYKAWLLNDTQHEFLLEIDLYTAAKDILFVDDKIASVSALELGDLLYDDLNDVPEVWLSVQRLTTAGPDVPIERTLKIRPKQFFNSLQTAPILNVLAHQLVVLDSFEPAAPPSSEGDLKAYTRQKTEGKKQRDKAQSSLYQPFNVEEYAGFVPEIDLHMEHLMKGYAKLDKSEILRIQMKHFHQFLEKAIRLGVPSVFVIHGVGEGKLRNAIAESLRQHPGVWRFKNEYHHKYGYGATEVIFNG